MKIEELKNNINANIRKQLRSQIKRYYENANEIIKLLDYIPEGIRDYDGWWFGSGMWPIYIDFPADFDLINTIRSKFIAAGWGVDEETPSAYGYTIKFVHPEVKSSIAYVYVCFNILKPGATCQVQQIGTVQKEEPVYEIVCADGAREETWK